MKSNRNTGDHFTTEEKGKKSSLTPRELINYHIEFPEEPITGEDIENLTIEYESTGRITPYSEYRTEVV